MKTFRNSNGKGFHITFPNGLTLSTQFGWGNYCDNYNSGLSAKEEMEKRNWESDNAEIAIIDKYGRWLTNKFKDNGDQVIGYVKINDWLEAFDWCRSYEPTQAGE